MDVGHVAAARLAARLVVERGQHGLHRGRLHAGVATQHQLQRAHHGAPAQGQRLGAECGRQHATCVVLVAERFDVARHQPIHHILQHIVLVGDEVHRAAEHLQKLRVALLRARDDLMAHVGPEPVGVRVRRVLAP